MTVFVVDNSVTLRWRFQNAAHTYADRVLHQLASGEKDRILTAAKADALLTAVNSQNIAVDQDGTHRIFTDVHRLAIAHRLTSDDAAFLEFLATLDAELMPACMAPGEAIL